MCRHPRKPRCGAATLAMVGEKAALRWACAKGWAILAINCLTHHLAGRLDSALDPSLIHNHPCSDSKKGA